MLKEIAEWEADPPKENTPLTGCYVFEREAHVFVLKPGKKNPQALEELYYPTQDKFLCDVCKKLYIYRKLRDKDKGRIRLSVGGDGIWSICRACWFEAKGVWAQEEVNKALAACDHARTLCSAEKDTIQEK